MFPLSDDNSDSHIAPVVNYLLILANILVFVLLQGLGSNDAFTYAFSTIPKEIMTGQDIAGRVDLVNAAGSAAGTLNLGQTPIPVYLTLITSMFMHGGIAHIGGNMLYLWIFGDNLENDMGHFKYLCFYLICGIIAGLSHVLTCIGGADVNSMLTPSLGASGAISGVLGGYVLLYPHRRVTVILFRQVMQVPAFAALGSWIFLQVIDSMGILGRDAETGGIAYAAHIGGFVAGIVLVNLFAANRRPRSYTN